MAHLENRIAAMAKQKGCTTPSEFRDRLQDAIAKSSAYELWGNPERYPDKDTQLAICEAFRCQPGEFLVCIFPSEERKN